MLLKVLKGRAIIAGTGVQWIDNKSINQIVTPIKKDLPYKYDRSF